MQFTTRIGFLFFNLITILFLFVFSEIAVGIFKPEIQTQGTNKALIADSAYFFSHGLKPFSQGKSNGVPVAVDQFGFRKYSRKIDKAKKSWLLMGDSVTMGIGVPADSTFAGILQAKLDSLNILNPSVLGYDIQDYLNVFQYFVAENQTGLNINHVTVFWCLNDIYFNIQDIETPGGQWRYFFSDFLKYIRTHSKLYHFTKKLIFDRPRDYFTHDQAFYRPENELFQNTVTKLAQIDSACHQKNIQFDVVLLPYEFQLRKNTPEFFLPQTRLATRLNKFNIRICNLLEKNRPKDSRALYLFGDGIHFSEKGHRWVAEYLLNCYR